MFIKKPEEIALIKENGRLIGGILATLAALARPGVSLWELDQEAEKMIIAVGGKPAFKGYRTVHAPTPFPSTICTSVNEELVHGIARKQVILKHGDILSLDIGMEWPCKNQKSKVKNLKSAKSLKSKRGYFSDTALTIPIGTVPEEVRKLLRVTKEALYAGIKAVKLGNSVADIGKAIQRYVQSQGKYGIIRDLVGHGVGYQVHEDPRIPNFYDPELEVWKLQPGMVIAIEPMISLGGERVKTMTDGWTIAMADSSPCAHFEHTVVVTKTGYYVATKRPGETI